MNHSTNPHVEALPERQPYCPGCGDPVDEMGEAHIDRKGRTWHETCYVSERDGDPLAVPLQPIRMQDFQPAIERIKRSL